MREFIKVLRMPNSVYNKGPISTSTTPEEHHQGWQWWQKKRRRPKAWCTVISKATSESPPLAEIDIILRELPFKHGLVSPEIWRSITYFDIFKKLGVYNVENMYTLQLGLMVTKFNMSNNNLLCGEVMANTKDVHRLPYEQAGSQKNRQSSRAALNKVLTMDLLRLLSQPGRLCSNDAKLCYNCIGHWVAIVCLMRLGMPYEHILSMFVIIQSAFQFIATAFCITPLVNMAGSAGLLCKAWVRVT
jgi:hypothetical protein